MTLVIKSTELFGMMNDIKFSSTMMGEENEISFALNDAIYKKLALCQKLKI